MARGIRRLARPSREPSGGAAAAPDAARSCSRTPPNDAAPPGRSPTPPGSSTAPTPTAGSPSSATASSASRSPSTCSARFPGADIGRLTKIHGQAVSGRACAEVAGELGAAATCSRGGASADRGRASTSRRCSPRERALASVCEAVIGACYLHHGFEPTARPPWRRSRDQIELAAETLLDFKSALQERLAREGARVTYEVTGEDGPAARPPLRGRAPGSTARSIGDGLGASKKAAEQAAAARGAGAVCAAS